MRVAIIGLGYVGLPLAVEFGKCYATTGFDLKSELIKQYANHFDPQGEVVEDDFKKATKLEFTDCADDLSAHDFYIIAVPTPVDSAKQPDLHDFRLACETVGKVMAKGATVIIESTVFPGATEEICLPILQKYSTLNWLEDFNIGYSPERINPGDKARSLTKIIKVVAGDCQQSLAKIADLYQGVITAGIYRAQSIKVAEAAKVIENAQRDLNIAFINELAIIFDKMGIDTSQVLAAAQTKWNFLSFKPGLVGGHCIGVDPYYLTHKAQQLGYFPEVILAGRRINDNMGKFIAQKTLKKMFAKGMDNTSRVLICGLSFKENCGDLRNSQVKQLFDELIDSNVDVAVHDPIADQGQAKRYYDIDLVDFEAIEEVDVIILAVAHKDYIAYGVDQFKTKIAADGVFIDVKSVFKAQDFASTSIDYWRL